MEFLFMKQITFVILILLSLPVSFVFGQDPNKMLSETKYSEERETFPKSQYPTFGFNIAREIFEENTPFSIFVYGGYEFCKTHESGFYYAIEPRIRMGYLSGDTDDDGDVDEYNPISSYYHTFAWGGSGAGRIGYILGDRTSPILYLEVDAGILNFHSKGRVKEFQKPKLHPVQNSFLNFCASARIGIMGDILGGDARMGIWVGISNLRTDQFLDKMELKSSEVSDRKFNGEIGFSFFF